ncbi:MAG TPA: transporter substrate-binding domain-containing protein [Alphaproteobacteria bacterium]|nr:transporter substrate-binding domain-containing protein [Alphaproteobacteria bacterium]
MTPRLASLVFAFGLAVSAALAAPAGRAEALRLVTGNDNAPHTDQSLPEGGVATDIVRQAFAAAGRDVSVEFLPWARGYLVTREGDYDATFPYLRTPEREREFLFSRPLLETRQMLFSAPRAKLTGRSLDELRGRIACTPNGYALPAEFAPMLSSGNLSVDRRSDLATCLRRVAAGRNDFVVLDEVLGRAAMAEAAVPAEAVVVVPAPVQGIALHLIVSRQRPEGAALIAEFDRGLAALRSSGAYERILKRHLPGG